LRSFPSIGAVSVFQFVFVFLGDATFHLDMSDSHPVFLNTALRIAVAAALLAPVQAQGQDNYEIQVYGSDLVPRGTTMVELHSNFTFEGTTIGQDGLRPTQHALHETLELTRGFADWFEVGFYLFTSTQQTTGVQWVGDHIRPRIAAPESWHLPVGLSLSQEIGYQRREYSTDTWTWEIRPIIDQKVGRVYWSLNPTLERALAGENVKEGFEFAPNAEVTVDVTRKVSAALEYYGAYGPATHWDPFMQTQQQLFIATNIDLGPDWEFNLGLGAGMTHETDHSILKVILGRRFGRMP
jgi:hypothetical protein